MMKTCGVVSAVWLPEESLGMVHRVINRFELLNDMEVRFIGDQELHNKFLSSAHYARYHAWNFVPSDVERIIYFDIDMLPLRPLPELPNIDFAAAPERQETYKECGDAWPVIKRAGLYFNTGMIIATRKTEPIFQRMLYKQTHSTGGESPWFADQSFFNVEVFAAVEAGEITFQELPRSWNSLILLDTVNPPPDEPYMIHYAGGHSSKLRLITHAITQLTNLERMIDIKKQYSHG
jgi:lipopolysaccharide biosynthesis glycosyltransferase